MADNALETPLRAATGKSRNASVIDMFCGAGGMSLGFFQEGYEILAGIDSEPSCKRPFKSCHGNAGFLLDDALKVEPAYFRHRWNPHSARVLIACCPCQPYSQLNYADRDSDTAIDVFAERFAAFEADAIVMENVPWLLSYRQGRTWRGLMDALAAAGYKATATVADASRFGTPQRRKRLITLAARDAWIPPLAPEHEEGRRPTLLDAIGDLPPLESGEADPDDRYHFARKHGRKSVLKFRMVPEGGDWQDMPNAARPLRLRGAPKGQYKGLYGRPHRDGPGKTITTHFRNPDCGPFIHYEQHRGYTLREGARIQGFPDSVEWTPEGERVQGERVARLIGNAVPPPLARAVAKQLASALGL